MKGRDTTPHRFTHATQADFGPTLEWHSLPIVGADRPSRLRSAAAGMIACSIAAGLVLTALLIALAAKG